MAAFSTVFEVLILSISFSGISLANLASTVVPGLICFKVLSSLMVLGTIYSGNI